jgi:hypothetical protein
MFVQERRHVQYSLQTLFQITSVVALLLAFGDLAGRFAGSLSAPVIHLEWHFITEPCDLTDLTVECVVDSKKGSLPERLGESGYKIVVPDSHLVTLKSLKQFGNVWIEDYIVTPNSPRRRRAYAVLKGSTRPVGPSEDDAREIRMFVLLE